MLITTDKIVRLKMPDGIEIVVRRLPHGRLGIEAPRDVLIDTEKESDFKHERERSNT